MARKLIILTALEIEARAVSRALDVPFRRGPGPLTATIAGRTVEIWTTGIRARRLPGALDAAAVCGLVMAGLAGALDPGLKVGDIVLEQSAAWRLSLPADYPFRSGAIHTAEQLIATVAEKAELFRRTGALAVDMENRIVREAAATNGVPFIGIRAISDTASEALDPLVQSLVDEYGRPRPGAVAWALLRRPSLVPYLRRLGANSTFAARQLGAAVRRLVEQAGHTV